MKKDKARRLVVLDTSFVLALRGADGAKTRDRALYALELHEGDQFGLPAPALAECLPGQVPPGIIILDMNAAAAVQASKFRTVLGKRGKASRREASIDILILGTAVAHGADRIYALDGVYKTIATEHALAIQVCELPPPKPKQLKLPDPPSDP